MATSAPVLVPLEEYLNTTYRPDRDWIGGETKQRNNGRAVPRANPSLLCYLFRLNSCDGALGGLPEQRVQISPDRYRIPDVCLICLRDPLVEMLYTPPLLCIEILSRDDSMSEIQERVEDYLAMGVQAVWVIDPRRRRVYEALPSGVLQPVPTELTVAGTEISVPIPDIFAELDEMETQPWSRTKCGDSSLRSE